MSKLKIPLALDSDGVVTRPEYANKQKRYFCPVCGDNLLLKMGEIKKVHFAHKATEICTEETVIHKTAKYLIIQSILKWKEGKLESPIIERVCQYCGVVTEQKIPDKIDHVKDEVKLNSGFIGDIALFSDSKPIAVIEIKVAHAVTEQKKETIGIPFIEVEGEKIINNPEVWFPITDKFKPFKCQSCVEAIHEYKNKIITISNVTKVPIPKTYFRTAFTNCWRCKKPILVFDWPDKNLHQNSKPSKPDMPKTIQYKFSKTIKRKYWVNTCPYCKSIQGDFFLFLEPDSPLFGFDCGPDTDEAFKIDLRKLAIMYTHRF